MKYRPFGNNGNPTSEVGLGCWQLGGADWGDVSDEDAFAILRAAVDAGVNFFDTADVYGLGRSESLIGQFLKTCSEPIVVATKLGRFPEPGWPGNFTREAVRAHTEASLQRLGVETIDLTQLHCIPTEELQRGDVFGWLRELQQEGKIRRFGASVESVEEAHICLEHEDVASLQIIFNIFRQKPITELFDRALQQGVAIIVRLPLASGLLSGKYTHETKFAPSDHRNYNRDGQYFNVGETFAGLPFDIGVEAANALKPFVPHGMTMAQMALRWCLDYRAVTTVIPGAKNSEMVYANAAACELNELGALHARFRNLYEEKIADKIRGPY